MAGDRIRLTGLTFYGYHGVADEERRLGQRFGVDLELWLDLRPAGADDDLTSTIDYSQVYRQVEAIVQGPSCRLIEAVAERIAAALLAGHARLDRVVVTVHKPGAPIPGAAGGGVSVTIDRARGD